MDNNTQNILDKELYDYLSDFEGCFDVENDYEEIDDRYWKSGIDDIEGGDNFIDYCEYIFDILEEEEYFN
jgi:hypothetical protein